MMLIIGLGNPGKKYQGTRHNAGYWIIDQLAKKGLENFVLTKSDAFMNLAGPAVKKIIKNYEIKTNNLFIIHDDIDLPIGKFKIQKGRGSAGHKGVQSIIDELGTKDFWRVRIGICPKKGKPQNVEKFVLQNFTKEEERIIKKIVGKAVDAIRNIN